MAKQKINRYYVSKHDLFLNKWDIDHPEKSPAQLKEIEKHERIFALRDGDEASRPSIFKRLLRVFED